MRIHVALLLKYIIVISCITLSMDKLPPISALFLTKFDVHTGYELRWFKSLDDETYSSKNLEFKSLPSGLHSVANDTICFVQNKGISNGQDELLYGLSVFKQNNHLQQIDNEGIIDRKKVKLYSLGILIDPNHLFESIDSIWKPKIYSSCWSYKNELNQLLNNFMNLTNFNDEIKFEDVFLKYFELHCFKGNSNLILDISQLNNIASNRPSKKHSFDTLSFIDSNDFKNNNDHMIDYLINLFNDFGPLIFKIWKLSLLRKSIIIYSPNNSSSSIVCVTDDEQNNEIDNKSYKIEDLSKMIYCISLISSIPKELQNQLVNSGVENLNYSEFNKPIYNICVNDILNLDKLDNNFIASTTDQIIVEKTNLYDYAIKLPSNNCMNETLNTPEIVYSKTGLVQLSSPRDFQRFCIIYNKLNNNSVMDELPSTYKNTYESKTITELFWNGFSWWATAGESVNSTNDKFNLEFESFDNLPNDNVEKLITIVGYFQKLTIKLLTMLIEIILNNAEENSENKTIKIESQDIYEMGLDPYNQSDCDFLIELVKIWWDKDVQIGSYCGELCCF